MSRAAPPTYYHYHGLGSVRAVTDGTGNIVAKYDYDVFGAIRSQTGTVTNDFRYTGEQRDAENEYYFLRARYYDPAIGRFISRDPGPARSWLLRAAIRTCTWGIPQ